MPGVLNCIKDKPQTTFGSVKANVLADKDMHFYHGYFCSVIRQSARKNRSASMIQRSFLHRALSQFAPFAMIFHSPIAI
jgi:hypothetical protein